MASNGNQGTGNFRTALLSNFDYQWTPDLLIADYQLISITFRLRGKAGCLAPTPNKLKP